jgi:hypothetical protein
MKVFLFQVLTDSRIISGNRPNGRPDAGQSTAGRNSVRAVHAIFSPQLQAQYRLAGTKGTAGPTGGTDDIHLPGRFSLGPVDPSAGQT